MIYMAVPLKIGYLPTLYHTSFVLRASGRMDDLGIKATWKLFHNGPEMVEAFSREELDLGYLGLPEHAQYTDGTGVNISASLGMAKDFE